MAPQLGMGTFRIEQGGMTTAFASSDGGSVEFWALHNTNFVEPSSANTLVTMNIHFLGPFDPDICAVVGNNGEPRANYHCVIHTKSPKNPC